MNNSYIIQNYAKALFDNAAKFDLQLVILEQITCIEELIFSDNKIKSLMCCSILANKEKEYLLDIIKRTLNIHQIIEKFLFLLLKHYRISLLQKIVFCYKNILNKNLGLTLVEITYANTISTEEQVWLKRYLEEKLIKGTLTVHFNKDCKIIGGIIIKYDDIIIDCSVRYLLKKIEMEVLKVFH